VLSIVKRIHELIREELGLEIEDRFAIDEGDITYLITKSGFEVWTGNSYLRNARTTELENILFASEKGEVRLANTYTRDFNKFVFELGVCKDRCCVDCAFKESVRNCNMIEAMKGSLDFDKVYKIINHYKEERDSWKNR
jgi:hypothetical protein